MSQALRSASKLSVLATRNTTVIATRNLSEVKANPIPTSIRKWMYNLAGYNQFGLYKDDCVLEARPEVQEAISRLPAHMQVSFRGLVRTLLLFGPQNYYLRTYVPS